MYKYFSITESFEEMMVMLKSLPAYTLVFDRKSDLVEINEPALKLLKLETVQAFNDKKDEIFSTHDYIKTIIGELRHGNTVRRAKTVLKYVDGSYTVVELCACMINGRQDLYIFQLFEIDFPADVNLGSFMSYLMEDRNLAENLPHTVKWVTNAENVLVSSKKKHREKRRTKHQVENISKRSEKTQYRKLTKLETLINDLRIRNLSIPQIATMTNKTTLSIRTMLRRIEEKQKLNFQNKEILESVERDYISNQE
jgi:hypothetical protein